MRASISWITISAIIVSLAACTSGMDGSTMAAYAPPGERASGMEVAGPRTGPPHLPNVEVGPNFGDRPSNAF